MFRISFMPARFGDSILIEYGSEQAPCCVLIDGGTRGTRHDIQRHLRKMREGGGHLELVVISHIDRDHIEGALGLLEESDSLQVGDLWFNGWSHLPDNASDEHFGAVQGERLSKRILDLGLPWNRAFDGAAVALPESGVPPRRVLPGGLEITLLSPHPSALAELKPVWEAEVREANLDPGFGLVPNDEIADDESFDAQGLPDVEALASTEFEDDRSEANGSSIAFLAEFEGKRALLGADAHAGVLEAALNQLSPDSPVRLDLFKISHHGSKNTTSRSLVEKVECPTYVFSTNGSIFKHPHHEAVARIIDASVAPQLVFNYRTRRNEVWDLQVLKDEHGYRTRYPDTEKPGVTISL